MTVRAVESWTLQPLTDYVHEAGARLVLLMTPAGQVLAQFGFTRAVDVMAAAALGAAIMATTTELARQLGQPPFAALNHQGQRHGIRSLDGSEDPALAGWKHQLQQRAGRGNDIYGRTYRRAAAADGQSSVSCTAQPASRPSAYVHVIALGTAPGRW